MEILATIAFSFGVIAYSVASTLYFLELVRPVGEIRTGLGARVLVAGALCHAFHLACAVFASGLRTAPGVQFLLSSAALVVVGSFFVLRRRRGLESLGAFVAPLALTFLVAAQFLEVQLPALAVSRWLLVLHVAANLLGLSFVLLAGGTSSFYLVVEGRLKSKRRPSAGARLPSLDELDTLGHRLLLAGFPLLTFGVVSGGVFFAQLGLLSGVSFARAVLGYVAWGLVAGVLALRASFGFSGRRTAYGTLWSVACLSLVLLVYVLRPLWDSTT
ncbi:MAG TPA: cytochrome c biogenesis protein CcsA [Polyangiaceae bacterium]|nr:cytochrome c biogenesis protein CcsA [Polyangiaceae bacterium]